MQAMQAVYVCVCVCVYVYMHTHTPVQFMSSDGNLYTHCGVTRCNPAFEENTIV